MKLKIENLSFAYGNQNIIKNMNLELDNGVYGLLGPNGAGKTTLINLLVTNLLPKSGKLYWKQQEIHGLGSEYRKVVGFKPQQQTIYPELTVEEFLNYMANLKGIPAKEGKEQILILLDKVNLTEHRKKKMRKLSGGMLQRSLLAQALLGNPELLKEYYERGLQEGKMKKILMQDEILILENLYYELFQ